MWGYPLGSPVGVHFGGSIVWGPLEGLCEGPLCGVPGVVQLWSVPRAGP